LVQERGTTAAEDETYPILTIEKGRIVESGSHDDLMKTGGRYAALWRLQEGRP
jgi:ABC-type multidrug transport system fused ATPase/permease subunit